MPILRSEDDDENEELMNKPLDPRLREYLAGSRINSERGLGANYMAAQAKALAQLGTLGGKASDTSAVSDLAQGISKSAAVDQAADESMLDRDTKLKQYLLGLKQQKELRQDDLAFKGKQLDVTKADKDRAAAATDETSRHNKVMEGIAWKQANTKADGLESKLPKDQLAFVTSLSQKNANKISVKNQIDEELKNMKDAWARGDDGQAITAGKNMLKVLNSTEGADAIAGEEAKRLAAYLEYKIANFTGPGSFVGRDTDEFMKQAAEKSNAIGRAVVENNKMIDRVKSGQGLPTEFSDQTLDIPKKGSAIAGTQPGQPPAGQKTVVKKQFSPSKNKTKLIYSDGTEEIVDGQR